jgi:hypothetical protein
VASQGFPTAEVHILDDKWRIDCDAYLDDAPRVLRDLAANRPDRLVCRYVRPWNRPLPGVQDVADFDEFRELLRPAEREPVPD